MYRFVKQLHYFSTLFISTPSSFCWYCNIRNKSTILKYTIVTSLLGIYHEERYKSIGSTYINHQSNNIVVVIFFLFLSTISIENPDIFPIPQKNSTHKTQIIDVGEFQLTVRNSHTPIRPHPAQCHQFGGGPMWLASINHHLITRCAFDTSGKMARYFRWLRWPHVRTPVFCVCVCT